MRYPADVIGVIILVAPEEIYNLIFVVLSSKEKHLLLSQLFFVFKSRRLILEVPAMDVWLCMHSVVVTIAYLMRCRLCLKFVIIFLGV